MAKLCIHSTLTVLLLLGLNLNGCAQRAVYLTNNDRIWFIKKGTPVKTTEGTIVADDDLVLGYRGHLFQDDLTADKPALE